MSPTAAGILPLEPSITDQQFLDSEDSMSPELRMIRTSGAKNARHLRPRVAPAICTDPCGFFKLSGVKGTLPTVTSVVPLFGVTSFLILLKIL